MPKHRAALLAALSLALLSLSAQRSVSETPPRSLATASDEPHRSSPAPRRAPPSSGALAEPVRAPESLQRPATGTSRPTREAVTLSRARSCTSLLRADLHGHFLAATDVLTATVAGDRLDALVSRGAAHAMTSEFAPDDLVDLRTRRPSDAAHCEPPEGQCLRSEAAEHLSEMFRAMRTDGHEGVVHSAFRSYQVQCQVFARWAYNGDSAQGFCRATRQSALAGHSQHQLGTTLDVFTRAWNSHGSPMRPGFGCATGGRWLAAHSQDHGFVIAYPLHPDAVSPRAACEAKDGWAGALDPRTGYEHEPWHLRYVGVALASEFARDQQAQSEPESFDQWLRHREGRADDADLPVCDGCACGACSTRADRSQRAPCPHDSMLHVDTLGRPEPSLSAPSWRSVRARRLDAGHVLFTLRYQSELGFVTQTPAIVESERPFDGITEDGRVRYRRGAAPRAYRRLDGAWRVVVTAAGVNESARFSAEFGLATARAAAEYNGASLYLPARSGEHTIEVLIPSTATNFTIAFAHNQRQFHSESVTAAQHP
ncbi:MAG: M15 family metallopeptidase [Deltaproteobacteria bacterium]|nr:M15 family metallopeptidase [Deltaproteobacteria bacterium]